MDSIDPKDIRSTDPYVKVQWHDVIGYYRLTSSYTDEPYIMVSNSYLPITTNTTNLIAATQPKIDVNGTLCRPLRALYSSGSTSYMTTSSDSSGLTSATALTRESTSGTSYLTRSSTSGTSYLTSGRPDYYINVTELERCRKTAGNRTWWMTWSITAQESWRAGTFSHNYKTRTNSVGVYLSLSSDLRSTSQQMYMYTFYSTSSYKSSNGGSKSSSSSEASAQYNMGFHFLTDNTTQYIHTSCSSALAYLSKINDTTWAGSRSATMSGYASMSGSMQYWDVSITFSRKNIIATTGTSYLTRSSTSGTSYLTCESTYGYTGVYSSSTQSGSGWV